MNCKELFPKGVLRPELLMGQITTVTAQTAQVSLSSATAPSGSYYSGGRYGRGEVGEFVLIEGQTNLVLGRVIEVRLDEQPKRPNDAAGRIQLLGTVAIDTLRVSAGVEDYPRLGDLVYAAPHVLVAKIPDLMSESEGDRITLTLGTVDVALESKVTVEPEKLFGRHLAILGSTGGGKSWTTAKVIEECCRFKSKVILFDATGEYRGLTGEHISHLHLAEPVELASGSTACTLPPECFQESDFIALFEPSGKVQGPKFKEAIRNLRLAKLEQEMFADGFIKKHNTSKTEYKDALSKNRNDTKIDDPSIPFDPTKLALQIEQECVWPDGKGPYNQATKKYDPDLNVWGDRDESSYSYCLSLITRIQYILTSPTFACVFASSSGYSLISAIGDFLADQDKKLLRLDLSGISFEYKTREILANVIGRYLLKQSRERKFIELPLILFVDEAHHFLGKTIGSEDTIAKLDAFELIAREGRKFGLTICLATQRPRDITEGVLSQMGTMIVHRLTNERDREVVERACGEIDRAASAFLPNLKPGEAAIIGNDFPIPLTIQMDMPVIKPKSSGPDYQKWWNK